MTYQLFDTLGLRFNVLELEQPYEILIWGDRIFYRKTGYIIEGGRLTTETFYLEKKYHIVQDTSESGSGIYKLP